MHRSRIGVLLIDHPAGSYDAAAAFWAGVTGTRRSADTTISDDDPYEPLTPLPGTVKLELQRTGAGTPPRLHLDIETDDVPAEVARVEALGARVATRHEGWAVMEDPGGMPFCVVPVQTGADFEVHATTWP
ncbi:VOC family protein [Phycicoccus sp.]|uniref:VOC family protein n=1 Tax=Phycicoccus sp. TaxID=1902410 RepID=UPI002C838C32|nr:VOC family protein [Phycicoccus sp.]HMM93468.1 VOC family protein [Phycicoccus sp.]